MALLQGTKAYGVHVRPLAVPARENRSEMHEQPNFYWNQERYLRERAAGQGVALVDPAAGADRGRFGRQRHERDPRARRLCRDDAARRQDQRSTIPAASAGWRRRSMPTFWRAPSPGRASRETAQNEIFNVTNGDVFVWPNVWPAIADALGFAAGEHVPLALDKEIRPREAEWAEIRAQHGLASGTLKEFVGLSFEYADYTMGYGRNTAGPAGARLDHQADAGGLPEVMDTEAMFAKASPRCRRRGCCRRADGGKPLGAIQEQRRSQQGYDQGGAYQEKCVAEGHRIGLLVDAMADGNHGLVPGDGRIRNAVAQEIMHEAGRCAGASSRRMARPNG